MKQLARVAGLALVMLLAFHSPSASSPGRTRGRPEPTFSTMSGLLYAWENEHGGVDCTGDCPGGPGCCGNPIR